jgi:predicted trehalose synthase
MLINNIPSNLPSVERLVQRVVAAERAQQKEIRLTIQEARELTAELAVVTSKLGKTITEIHTVLADIKNNKESRAGGSESFDGGTF